MIIKIPLFRGHGVERFLYRQIFRDCTVRNLQGIERTKIPPFLGVRRRFFLLIRRGVRRMDL